MLRGNRILACAASNVAVDNLVERISKQKKVKAKVVRLGHPARLLPQVIKGRCGHENGKYGSHIFEDTGSTSESYY